MMTIRMTPERERQLLDENTALKRENELLRQKLDLVLRKLFGNGRRHHKYHNRYAYGAYDLRGVVRLPLTTERVCRQQIRAAASESSPM